MDWLAGQLAILGRRSNGDEEGWMQLLVFIVLAVFWAIGGIMKARSAKARDEKQRQQSKPRPQPRPRPSFERLLRSEPEKARTRAVQVQRPRPGRRFERDKGAREQVKEPVAVQSSESVKDVLAEVDKIDHIGEIAPMEAAMAAVAGQGIELGTSEQLRAAMLHYEIFGKCVGLRESREHVWMR
jgi:hypothetical protein